MGRLFLNSTSLGISSIALAYLLLNINGALPTIKVLTGINGPNEGFYEGLLVSGFSIGSLIGCLIAFVIVKIPRSNKILIRIIDLFTIVAISLSCITNFWTILAGRVLLGTVNAIGIAIVPLYFKEITPVEVYGLMGGFDKLL